MQKPAEAPTVILPFDDFMTRVKDCDKLLDAFSLRDSLNSELHKKRTEISNFLPDDIIHGVKVSDVQGKTIYYPEIN